MLTHRIWFLWMLTLWIISADRGYGQNVELSEALINSISWRNDLESYDVEISKRLSVSHASIQRSDDHCWISREQYEGDTTKFCVGTVKGSCFFRATR